jgi:hypothetical protein
MELQVARNSLSLKGAYQLPLGEEFVAIFHNLVCSANQVQVVSLQELCHHIRSESERHATVILRKRGARWGRKRVVKPAGNYWGTWHGSRQIMSFDRRRRHIPSHKPIPSSL